MTRLFTLRLIAFALLLTPYASGAQTSPLWRNVEVSRQLRDSLPQRIRVQYGSGRVDLRGTSEPQLYAMHLRYDELRSIPVHRYDASQRSTVLGLERRAGAPRSGRDREAGELRLSLPRAVPLELELRFGGTEARLDLGGMALTSVRLECGATDAVLAFALPNRARMRELDVSVGAASFSALHLANANADLVRIRGGVGSVDLDFSGTWTRDLLVSTRLAVGKLTIRVPDDVGVRLEVRRVAAGFEHQGLVKRDDAWYSPNFDSARYKLRVRAETVFGQIEIRPSSR